jgi:Tol biopolymer transport system component
VRHGAILQGTPLCAIIRAGDIASEIGNVSDTRPPHRIQRRSSALVSEETLNSWKAIANYLGRTVRTVQRWEQSDGLPVRRIQHDAGSSVYAFRHEIDAWLTRRNLAVISGSASGQDESWASSDDDAEVDGAPGTAPTQPPPGLAAEINTQRMPEPGPEPVSRPAIYASETPSRRWLGVAAVAVGLVLLVVLARAYLRNEPALAKLRTPDAVTSRTLTTMSGIERTPVLSPDGRQVAYTWQAENGQVDLFLRMIDQDQSLQLTNDTLIEESPVYSPDGLWVAYLRRSGTAVRELMVLPVLGGTPRLLERFEVPLRMDEARSLAASVSWHPGGEWLAVTAQAEDKDNTRIVAWSLKTTEQRALTNPPAGSSDLSPAFSPDGRQLVFTRSASVHNGSLLVTSVALDGADNGPQPMRSLPSATPWDYQPVWSLDGRELVFSGGRFPNTRLWRIPADGSAAALPFAGTEMGGSSPSLAMEVAPGTGQSKWRMVYSSMQLDNDLWRVSLQDGQRQRLLGSSQRERFPAFAPDGQQLVFLSDRSGYREVWSVALEGKPRPQQWTDWKSSYVWRPSWSPDGSRLAYVVELDNVLKLYVQDRPLVGATQLTVDTAADEDLAWSHDGQSIFTTSPDRHAAGSAIYRYPLSGGGPEFVVQSPGKPIGEDAASRLYLEIPDGNSHLLGVFNPEDQVLSRPELSPAQRHSFARGPDGIFFVAVTDEGAAIHRWSFASEAEELVVRLQDEPERGLAISPDGSQAVLSEISLLRGDLMLAEGL